jgi:fibronectin-binding autotransporter adhesin
LANIFDDSESNVIASISSNTTIHRLIYDFDFSQVTSTATLRFQLAANPTTLYWLGSNGTAWTAGNNWSFDATGASTTNFASGKDMIFSAAGSSNSTNTDLGGDRSIASLTINSTAGLAGGNLTGTTTINSGTLTIGNGGSTGSLTGDITNNSHLAFNRSDNSSYHGAIEGTGGLNKLGAGTFELSGNNTYTGATNVGAGKLVVNGSITSNVTVQSGATIGGNGRIGGLILDSGSTLDPGTSPGTLSVDGNATWSGGAHYNWQVYATNPVPGVQTGAGTGWDFLDVSGTLTLDPASVFNLNLWSLSQTGPDINGTIPGWDPTVGSTWLIASAGNGIYSNGTALTANTNYTSLFNINTAAINGAGGWIGALPGGFQVVTLGSANSLYLHAFPGSAAVPEPGQVAASLLLLACIGGYAWMMRRKAKAIA